MDTMTPPATDDRALALGLASADRSALEEAYRRHAGVVLGLARRLTRNQALAEDVTQEVFVRLWRDPNGFDPARGSLRTYLLTITHRRAVDVIRSEQSRRIREDKDGMLASAGGASLEDEVVEMQMGEQVRAALESLPPQERGAIELAYFGGHSYRMVAELLGEPEGTVKSRIRKGMTRLGATLRASGFA